VLDDLDSGLVPAFAVTFGDRWPVAEALLINNAGATDPRGRPSAVVPSCLIAG
jgi:hypothetical protein